MKRFLIFSFIVLSSIVLFSCMKSSESTDLKSKIAGARSYISVADITVNSNKGTSNYKVKQYCSYPGRIRIETLEPDFLKNKVLVGNNGDFKIFHPLINQTLRISKLMETDEFILMGIMDKELFSSKDSELKECSYNGKECYSIMKEIPKANRFRKGAVLYIDKATEIPVAMDILDDNGDKKVEVKYTGFTYNTKLSDSIFDIK